MDTNKEVTHLTSEERRSIETGIRKGATKTAIANTIGKNNSNVGKEIKLHGFRESFFQFTVRKDFVVQAVMPDCIG